MKNALNIIFALIISFPLHAQNSWFQYCHYKVDSEYTVLAKYDKATPSVIRYYSKVTGGKLLGIEQASPYSTVVHNFPHNKLPYFILCEKTSFPLNNCEFKLNNLTAQYSDGQLTVTFDAEAFDHSKTIFNIFRKDGDSSQLIGSYSAATDQTTQSFGYSSLQAVNSGTQFYLVVEDVNEGERYSSLLYSNNNSQRNALGNNVSDVISVLPNLTNSTISVQAASTFINHSFIIFDVTGKEVLHGILSDHNTNIDVSSFRAGYYYLKVDDKALDAIRFQKL